MMSSLIFIIAPIVDAVGHLGGVRLAAALVLVGAFIAIYARTMLRGRMDAAPGAGGGFRFAVTVPLEAVS
jgi:hypothetical protein